MSARRVLRPALVVVGLVVALNLAGVLLGRYLEDPGGPSGSSYATAPEGLAAYAELLRRDGRTVRALRTAPSATRLDPRATVVLARPEKLEAAESRALRRFVERGGRLVAGGPNPGGWLDDLLDAPPVWDSARVGRAVPLVPVPEAAGVGAVAGTGLGAWTGLGGTLPALRGEGGRVLLAVASPGRGRLALLSDLSPLENRTLGAADNAALAVALAGQPGRPVLFVESAHGFGAATGLAAVPGRWLWALGGLVLAALVLMVARGRRLGPPEASGRALAPPRVDYALAMGGALAKTKRPGEAVEPVRTAARRRLEAHAGLPPGADYERLRPVATRAGLPSDEIRAVLDGVEDEAGALAAGRALARLSGAGV